MLGPMASPAKSTRRRRRRLVAVLAAVIVLAGGAYGVVAVTRGSTQASGPPCTATNGTTTFAFDTEQAANAATIAAVAKRTGLADHAVTVGLVAALQESRLRNLSYGDLDSLGLFQQRPSQGWGTPVQILTPSYAAGAFFQHLAQVSGWQTLPVAAAAQAVQHSAAPDAYAQWEPWARATAEALTGEVTAGFTCRLQVGRARPGDGSALVSALAAELGPVDLSVPVSAPMGWLVVSWMIGHAQQYRVSSLAYAGWKWTASAGKWVPSAAAGTSIELNGGPLS